MTPVEWTVAATVMFVGSIVYSTFGFGMGLIAVPFLLLVDTRLVPGTFLVVSIVVTVPQIVGERTNADWPALVALSVGRLPGSAAAGLLLASVAESTLAVIAALSILGAVALSVAGYRLPNHPLAHGGAGVMSGLAGTIAGVGGPPAVLALHHLDVVRLRATMLWVSFTSFAVSIPTVLLAGRLGRWELAAAVALMAPVAVGSVVSRWVRPRVGRPDIVRRFVWALSTFGATGVIVREIVLGAT